MIENFIYNTPTTMYFGKGCIKDLPEVLNRYGKNVLLTYGGGEIAKGLAAVTERLPNLKNTVSLLNKNHNDSKQNGEKIENFVARIGE